MTITPRGWLLNLVCALARNEPLHVTRPGTTIDVHEWDGPPQIRYSQFDNSWRMPVSVSRAWLVARFPAEYAAAVLGDGAMEISKRKAFAVFKSETAKRGKIGEGAVARQRTMKL